MGFLENFEKTLEKKVTGLFSKTFKSGLEPVEIAAAIKQEMDSKASILARDRILVPNSYLVKLSPEDYGRLQDLGEPLLDELAKVCSEHAQSQKFQFGDLLDISLAADSSMVLGQLSVASSSKKLNVEWVPVIQINGVSHPLVSGKTTVGRDSTSDIQIEDNGLSRKHFELLWDGSSAVLRDLGSTNGVKVNGMKIDQVVLVSGSTFSAGRTHFLFDVIARAK